MSLSASPAAVERSQNSQMQSIGKNILHYHKIADANTAGVLIFGSEGTYKHDIAKLLAEQEKEFVLQIRTASKLPLPSENDVNRPRIDFIIFMIDQRKMASFDNVKSALCLVDRLYFLGRTCFVVTGGSTDARHSVEDMEIIELSQNYNSPLLFLNLKSSQEAVKFTIQRLISMVKLSAGLIPSLTPSMVLSVQNTNFNESAFLQQTTIVVENHEMPFNSRPLDLSISGLEATTLSHQT